MATRAVWARQSPLLLWAHFDGLDIGMSLPVKNASLRLKTDPIPLLASHAWLYSHSKAWCVFFPKKKSCTQSLPHFFKVRSILQCPLWPRTGASPRKLVCWQSYNYLAQKCCDCSTLATERYSIYLFRIFIPYLSSSEIEPLTVADEKGGLSHHQLKCYGI